MPALCGYFGYYKTRHLSTGSKKSRGIFTWWKMEFHFRVSASTAWGNFKSNSLLEGQILFLFLISLTLRILGVFPKDMIWVPKYCWKLSETLGHSKSLLKTCRYDIGLWGDLCTFTAGLIQLPKYKFHSIVPWDALAYHAWPPPVAPGAQVSQGSCDVSASCVDFLHVLEHHK